MSDDERSDLDARRALHVDLVHGGVHRRKVRAVRLLTWSQRSAKARTFWIVGPPRGVVSSNTAFKNDGQECGVQHETLKTRVQALLARATCVRFRVGSNGLEKESQGKSPLWIDDLFRLAAVIGSGVPITPCRLCGSRLRETRVALPWRCADVRVATT